MAEFERPNKHGKASPRAFGKDFKMKSPPWLMAGLTTLADVCGMHAAHGVVGHSLARMLMSHDRR